MIKKNTLDLLFRYFETFIFVCLIFGIPLVFSSETRSVFEVNKLLLLRISTLLVLFSWICQSIIYRDNDVECTEDQTTLSIFGFKWRKTGIDLPILLWITSTILSTLFSQNIILSVIGAYDRWEGLPTTLNYIALLLIFMKRVDSKRVVIVCLWSIVISTALSAIYGILQSLGIDFMNWSADATVRVFACINNPVHFCAYMAMVVPLGIGWACHLSENRKSNSFSKRYIWIVSILVIMTILIYYGLFLSYSRAAWLGFVIGLSLLYLSMFNIFNMSSARLFIAHYFILFLAIGVYSLSAIFNLHSLGLQSTLLIFLPLLSLFLLDCYKSSRTSSWVHIIIGSALMFGSYGIYINSFYQVICSALFLIFLGLIKTSERPFFGKYIIVFIFLKLQFIGLSLVSFLTFLSLLVAFYITCLYLNSDLKRMTKGLLFFFVLIFSLIILWPSLIGVIDSYRNADASRLTALANVNSKINSFQSIAIEGSARTSMWKSSLPWIADHWLLGSGLDTVKYMYPTYRRADYGPLEGGHEFTPDRLHNEYLNTLSTKGIVGFVVYYGLVIFGLFYTVLTRIQSQSRSSYSIISMALLSGGLVYLVQVLFNFGVVATLFLFYVLMGLSYSSVDNHE